MKKEGRKKSRKILKKFLERGTSTSVTRIVDLMSSLFHSLTMIISIWFRSTQRLVCMVRSFPDNGRSTLSLRFGYMPGLPETVGEFNNKVLSVKLPVVCRQIHSKQPFSMFKGENGMNYSFSTFLIETILIIFFIKVACFLLRPLRQPRIIGEIIGGMVIGPSMLGQSRHFNYYLFPPIANYLCGNLGLLGLFYFVFLTASKTDLTGVWKAPKKHKYIACLGLFVPMICLAGAGVALRPTMDQNMQKVSSIGGIAFAMAFTSFPVIYTVLRDINLLNSEVGKFAMSVALIGDMAGIYVLIVFEAMTHADKGGLTSVIWFFVSVIIVTAFMLLVVKRGIDWVVTQTPDGKLVDQSYIVILLMGVLASCFITDMFGMTIALGPIWLGLLVPHGPPLCSTLVVRSETFVHEFLMPFTFALVGLNTNVHYLRDKSLSQENNPLFYLSLVSFVTKFVSITGTALFFKVPTRDSITLGLILNLRGQIDLLLYLHWIDKRIVGLSGFSVMVVHTILTTGIITPIISFLYDPNRPYRCSKHRTIQHTPQNTEMGLVLAVSDLETLSGLTNFLDFTFPTTSNPLDIYAVQLVEILGRHLPMFVDHKQREEEEEEEEDDDEEDLEKEHAYTRSGRVDQIRKALRLYQEKRSECVKLRAYSAHAPKRLMFQDICELALVKKTAFILLPYQKERLEDTALTELRTSGMLSVNSDVLDHTPCSVCIYYDKGRLRKAVVRTSVDQQHLSQSSGISQETYRFVVLFLGGADNREALHLADRMTANPDITMTVIRFLSHNHEGEDEKEKKLDDGVVTWFWVKNEANERVSYKEVVVKNGAETLAAIQAMNINDYDLWITGRREGINPKILEGLSTWSEDHQLGVIGDTVAGSVFASEGSVLVVQQQVRNQEGAKTFFNCRFEYMSNYKFNFKFDYKSILPPWSRN